MGLRKPKSQPQVATESTPDNQPGGKSRWRNGVPVYGWYRLPDDQWWNYLPRLQRGLYQRMLIEYIWARMVPREGEKAAPEVSPWLSYVELAEKWGCTPDQLRDDARDAHARGLIEVEESKRQGFRAKILWDRWQYLKPYEAPKPTVLKKEAVAPSSRWLAGVSVKPGGSYDFVVPELPADFKLQKISLRNTGESGEVVFAGGGPADGGIIVLEAQSEKSDIAESKTSEVIRDSTPVQKRSPVAKKPNAPTVDPVVQQICDAIGTYGPVTKDAITRLIAAAHAPAEQVLKACGEIRPPESAENPVGWMMSMIPRYIAGAYKPRSGAKKQSERDKRAMDALNSMLGRNKIA